MATVKGAAKYVVDANTAYAQVVLELENGSQVRAAYVHSLDLVKMSRSGEYFYYYDGLGSTRQLRDGDGDLTNTYLYDAYGNQLLPEADHPNENPYQFTGEWLDEATGLYFLRARYYDPSAGRFTQTDPFLCSPQDAISGHRYLYCTADPVNLVDLTGLAGRVPTGTYVPGPAFLEHMWLGRDVHNYLATQLRADPSSLAGAVWTNYTEVNTISIESGGRPIPDWGGGRTKPDLSRVVLGVWGEVYEMKPLNIAALVGDAAGLWNVEDAALVLKTLDGILQLRGYVRRVETHKSAVWAWRAAGSWPPKAIQAWPGYTGRRPPLGKANQLYTMTFYGSVGSWLDGMVFYDFWGAGDAVEVFAYAGFRVAFQAATKVVARWGAQVTIGGSQVRGGLQLACGVLFGI